MKLIHVGLLGCVLVLLSSSCQRSQGFKKDQDYYQPSDDSSYYKSKSPSSSKTDTMGQPKKRVLVFDFWNDTPIKSEIGSFAADEMRRGLHLTQRMILSPEIKSEYVTADFVHGNEVRVAQLVREGRKLGISVAIIGRVTKTVFRQKGDDIGVFRQKQSLASASVEIKLFDITGGREIGAVTRSGEASSSAIAALDGQDFDSAEFRYELTKMAVRNAVALAVVDVVKTVDKLAWEGRIAKVVGNKIYVNAGHASGLISGDILRVMAPGEDIYDPSSGAFLGRTKGQLKGTLEVIDFIGADGSITQIHTGGNFQENDLVELY